MPSKRPSRRWGNWGRSSRARPWSCSASSGPSSASSRSGSGGKGRNRRSRPVAWCARGWRIFPPIVRAPPRRYHYLLLGVVAGAPTITGTWIGGLTYSVLMAILFLAIGAGAIFQVIYEIVRFQARRRPVLQVLTVPHNLVGLVLGFLVMYVTGLWVAV